MLQLDMRNIAFKAFLFYLRLAAQIQLLKTKPNHIVGITGSVGKTSCKEAVYAVLKDKYRVKEGKKSFNSEIGLPLDILGFDADYASVTELLWQVLFLTPWKLLTNWNHYEVYIAEMGVDKPGDMSYLLSFIKPDIGVFLNALPVHAANFKDGVEGISHEKGKLIESLPVRGTAILNGDDPNVAAFKHKTEAKVMLFGEGKDMNVQAFTLDIPGYLITAEQGMTLAAAAAVGMTLGLTLDEVKAELTVHLRLPPGRMSVFEGIKGTTIIDSTYNASRYPMISALKALKAFKGKRKIAVLGDMRELGDMTKVEHEEVAKEAVNSADLIFTFGPLMKENLAPKLKSLGYSDKKVSSELKMQSLINSVINLVKSGDVILVKGSQNTIMLEALVEKLLKNPEDKDKLCRRGEFWEKKREVLLAS